MTVGGTCCRVIALPTSPIGPGRGNKEAMPSTAKPHTAESCQRRIASALRDGPNFAVWGFAVGDGDAL